MLTSVEGKAVQAFSKGNNFLPHCVVWCWRFSLDDVLLYPSIPGHSGSPSGER
jgi:hypothetical protein